MNLGKYNKLIVAVIGGAVQLASLYYGQDTPSWINTLIAIATALGVYQVPNKN